jgi:long-chain acyl-CoA synthetase
MRKFAIEKAIADIVETNETFALGTAVIHNIEFKLYNNSRHYLPDMLRQSYGAYDDGEADYLVYQNQRWTFPQFCQNIKLATWFMQRDLYVMKGDCIAIAMRNYPDFLILKMAIALPGATVIFLNAWWKMQELKYALSDSDADDDFAIMYSSDTTSHPKGVVQTHRGVISAVYTCLMQGGAVNRAACPTLGQSNPIPPPPAILVETPLFYVTDTYPVFLLGRPAGAKVCLM